jgi:16S rRNA (cytosine967-C5)-methyltransferase
LTLHHQSWTSAAGLVAHWIGTGERIDQLMETLPRDLTPTERARSQYLVFGVVRHCGRIEAALGRLIAHPPRFITRAVLLVAGFELIEAAAPAGETGQIARIIHHAVEQAKGLASPAEARLVNAVARKLAAALADQAPPGPQASAEALAEYYSHPAWLVRRWLGLYGPDSTRALLLWNQQPAPLYARRRDPAQALPAWARPTDWPGFFEIPSGHWAEVEPLLRAKTIYVQDPSTRIAVDLLAPCPGEAVLDLCAAPGGKSLLAADRLAGRGRLVAVDLPGPRFPRLGENLAGLAGVEATVLEGDIRRDLDGLLRRHRLPAQYPAVLLDAPCTNTGVMRHRIDVKWRLQEGDFPGHARQQAVLLTAAARWVEPGGRLVYSTCSIDAEENERVVAAFLQEAGPEFVLEEARVFFPWEAGHDGGAAFRLRRRATAPSPPP